MIRATVRGRKLKKYTNTERNKATTVISKGHAKCAHANFGRMKVSGVNQVSSTRDVIG